METTRMIETKNLVKKYGNFTAVDNLSFTLNKGDIYGLIGKNGAGKSTLLKMIMGLSQPNAGSVSILNSKNKFELEKARLNIGFMMDPGFFGYLNAHQNLEYFRRLKGISNSKEVEEALKLVDMNNVKKPFKAYSMGMKQRLAVANALMGKPDIIIMDEPINGLDPEGIADFRKMIIRLNKEEGISFIVSSHILSELALMATRFGFIDHGVLLKEMTQQEIHDANQQSLIIKVDNVQKATALIEEELKTNAYKVNGEYEIILYDYIQQPEVISNLMVHHGLKLYKITTNEITLEEYFLNLVGGHQNA